jgi:hypothetical protein
VSIKPRRGRNGDFVRFPAPEFHSYRNDSAGATRAALRAGYNVATMLTAIAAAAIHKPSIDRGSNGTKAIEYTC